MKRLIGIIILAVCFQSVTAQAIKFGDPVENVVGYVRYTTGSNGSWDIVRSDGIISHVLQCYDDAYLADFRLVTDFCRYYLIKDNSLSAIITEYDDVTLEKLIEMDESENVIGSYYFSNDYSTHTTYKLSSAGLAVAVYQPTKLDSLPKEVSDEVRKRKD